MAGRYYTLVEIFNRLERASGRNDKIAILMSELNNAELRTAFYLALSPFVQFYIKKRPEFMPARLTDTRVEHYLKDADSLAPFYRREVTGNAAIGKLTTLLERLDGDNAEILLRIVTKDLKCGVNVSTANKVWPALIEEFPCMLCQPYSEKAFKKIAWPAIAQEKCDGMRVNFIVSGNLVQVRGRSGKPIELHEELSNEMRSMRDGLSAGSCVFDGELLVLDKKGKVLPRKVGNGILNKAVRGKISPEEASRVVTVLWDVLPLKDWEAGKTIVTPYAERFRMLKTQVLILKNEQAMKELLCKVDIPKTVEVADEQEAFAFYKGIVADGKEGVIIKNILSPWENKRSQQQVKLKVEREFDLKVVGMDEGTGKNVGKLGALCLSSADGGLLTSVGTGFSDAQREEFWQAREMIGRIVTVRANDLIDSDAKDTKALFLPVFVELREDKSDADSLDKVRRSFEEVYGMRN